MDQRSDAHADEKSWWFYDPVIFFPEGSVRRSGRCACELHYAHERAYSLVVTRVSVAPQFMAPAGDGLADSEAPVVTSSISRICRLNFQLCSYELGCIRAFIGGECVYC